MQPLEQLLSRIRWDPEFGKAAFALGYYDRVAGAEDIVRFESITMDPQRPGMFSVRDEFGTVAEIPLHRVRTVYKDGVAIWHRRARS